MSSTLILPDEPGSPIDQRTRVPRGAGRSDFRPEVQALRALAVTAIVLYHLWPHAVPGGFTGVDVFFVISGFLITRQLVREVRGTGRLSLTEFWARRIRRLLPAAFLVLAVCLVVLLALPPVLWQLNLEQDRASAGYVLNWLLASDAVDYLAAGNDPSMLQHYWSLSVEEQFYVVWPLLIVGALGLGGRARTAEGRLRRIRWVLAVVFVTSLGLSVALTPKRPPLAFYATPLRAWEFAAGGLLALLLVGAHRRVHPSARAAASWIGWGTLIGSAFLIRGATVQFPGWVALLPVLGATCCIAAGDPAMRWAPRPLIRHPSVQWVGDHSYAIYLWHWPLIIAAPWILGGALTWPSRLAIVVVTLVLAAASKRFVEDPVRTSSWWRARRRRPYVFALAGSVLLIALSSAWISTLDRTWTTKDRASQVALDADRPCYAAAALVNGCADAFRRPSGMDIAFAAQDYDPVMSRCEQPVSGTEPVFCSFGVEHPAHTVAVIGNSHALRLVPALERWGRQHGWRVLLAAKTDCLGTVIPGEGRTDCVDWSRNVQQRLIARGDVDVVVFGSHVGARDYMAGDDPTPADLARVNDGVTSTFETYRAHGIQVMVTGDVPGTRPDLAPTCVAASSSTVDPCSRPRAEADVPNTLGDIAIAHPALTRYVPLADFLCDRTTCHAVVGGVVVYTDSHHLTTSFSRSLAPYLGPEVQRLVDQPLR